MPVQPRASASSLLILPTPSTRSRKMRFLRMSFSPSFTICITRGRPARIIALKSAVGAFAIPPTRPKLWVTRAPVSSSKMSQMISRARAKYRNGVKAPSSMHMAPEQIMWSQMRASSPSTTR